MVPLLPGQSKIQLADPRYAKALAHPLRLRILAMLGERAASPVQLAQKLDATSARSPTTCARCTISG